MAKKVEKKMTKKFTSVNLTKKKFKEIWEFAEFLLSHRIQVSKIFHDNKDKFLSMSEYSFGTHMNHNYPGHREMPSHFNKALYRQVFVDYDNMYKQVLKKSRFELFLGTETTYYKRNTKKNKKGDIKSVKRLTKSTNLTMVMTYLLRHGNENIFSYIQSQVKSKSIDNEQRNFYLLCIQYINKYGFDRLYNIVLQRRQIIKKNLKMVKYEKHTIIGRTRKDDIIKYNKNYNSEINSFIQLSWFGHYNKGGLYIPTIFNKDYHGDIKDYHKSSPDYSYVLTFDEKRKRIVVNYAIDDDREVDIDTSVKTNFIGCDANTKNNQFIFSNNVAYDYDRDLVKEYATLLVDEAKERAKNPDYKLGKRKRIKVQVLTDKMEHSTNRQVVSALKGLYRGGYNHIVMEDIDGHMGKTFAKNNEFGDINYNNLNKFIGLGSLKGKFKILGLKFKIDVSLVQAHYTSKECSKCGCIDDRNRTSQEIFKCVGCGLEINADLNAALNILYRAITAVSVKLLKQNANGIYSPRGLPKDKIKEIILAYRSQLPFFDKTVEEYMKYLEKFKYRLY